MTKCELCGKKVGGWFGKPGHYKWKEKTVCLFCFFSAQVEEAWNNVCPICKSQTKFEFGWRYGGNRPPEPGTHVMSCQSCSALWTVWSDETNRRILYLARIDTLSGEQKTKRYPLSDWQHITD